MANYMEPEALSFQPSGDFKVRSFGRTGPMDGPIREVDDGPDGAQPRRVASTGKKPATPLGPALNDSGSRLLQPPAEKPPMSALQVDTPFLEFSRISQPNRTAFGSTFGSSVGLYSQGTEHVPGRGSGKVDTVPAMLAPGEAVLNRAAAENMGRGNIAQMNADGARQMGLGMRGSDEMRHYAAGTEQVMRSNDMRDQGAVMRSNNPMDNLPRGETVMYDPSQPSRSLPPAGGRGYADNFQPAPVMQPGANPFLQQQLAQSEQPAFDAAMPRIDRGPAVGIPNRPARQPAGPPAPPYAPMNTAGWTNPGAMNYGGASQPAGPNMGALYGSMAEPAWDADFIRAHSGGQADTLPPAMMMPEQPFQPPVMQPTGYGMRRNPALGAETARGGLSAFERRFAAERKAQGSGGSFMWHGERKNTKLAGER